MNRILVDTSVWIEFFSKNPRIPTSKLEFFRQAIVDGEIVIIEPIRAEILSGQIAPSKRKEVQLSLSSLEQVDLDLNSRATWDQLISYSSLALSHQLSVPGLIDRIILYAAHKSGAVFWTQDKAVIKLAPFVNVALFE